jgi:hypothetical protein
MTLTIQSFGSRFSFEMIKDEVVIGGLAYASEMRSPKGNAAFASAKAHIHGVDIEITAQNSNSMRGAMKFYISKADDRMGELEFDWKGRGKLELLRVDGGKDEFKIKPKGVNSWWFLVEQNGHPILELRPTEKFSKESYDFEVRPRSRRMPPRIMDELCVYCGFAANIYMAKMASSSRGR